MNHHSLAFRALIVAVLVVPTAANAYEVWSGEYSAHNRDWFRAATYIAGGDWIVVGDNNQLISSRGSDKGSTHAGQLRLRSLHCDY
jgi:hypothetical protein